MAIRKGMKVRGLDMSPSKVSKWQQGKKKAILMGRYLGIGDKRRFVLMSISDQIVRHVFDSPEAAKSKGWKKIS